jgi:hypothetical protein
MGAGSGWRLSVHSLLNVADDFPDFFNVAVYEVIPAWMFVRL